MSKILLAGIIDEVSLIFIYPILLILTVALFSCSHSTSSEEATISVFVTDNDADETPVPGVRVALVPGNEIKETNENGFCSFIVDPGDYFIDADLCCIGPGFIHYHEPVTVSKGGDEVVRLFACLQCE